MPTQAIASAPADEPGAARLTIAHPWPLSRPATAPPTRTTWPTWSAGSPAARHGRRRCTTISCSPWSAACPWSWRRSRATSMRSRCAGRCAVRCWS
ncbi:hypothetical protein ACFQZ4_54400 [Catellatospora coxensis]